MDITTTVDGSKALLVLAGKLTVQTSQELTAALDGLPGDICDIDIDLADVVYIASAGLRVLVGASKLADSRGGQMRLLSPCDEVYDVLEMTGLSEVFAIER